MAEANKVLAQVKPAAATQTTLYTVPGGGVLSAVGHLTICNQGAATTFRVRINIAGAGDDDKQYLFYDTPIGAGESIPCGPIVMATTDVMKVYATLATVNFVLQGTEVS